MNQLTALRLFGITSTILAYMFALYVHRRIRWLHPLLVTCGLLIAMLLILPHTLAPMNVDDYKVGGDVITFFLGPATVALAVPLYKHRLTLRRHALQIAVSIVVGGITGILSAAAIAIAFHASHEILRSVLSKSATTPISVEITKALGGHREIAAALTVCSGLVGAVLGPPLLRLLRLRKNSAIGLAIGTSSHGIGTSSVLRHSELQGTYAALALALNGILTATLLTPLAPFIQRLL
jgi:predicted murein hydrolase (TIGR00659 family)